MKIKYIVNMALSLALATALILSSFLFTGDELPMFATDGRAQRLTGITYETANGAADIVLPATLKDLPPRTLVTLYAQIPPGEGSLFVKSVFAPARLYLNDTLTYEFGQEGSYPAFMNDPPTGLAIIPLPVSMESVSLRLEYLSPSQRNEISIPAIYFGGEESLITMLVHAEGFSLLFSFMLLFIGMAMLAIYFVFVREIPGGMAFLWLGLFSLAAGIWVLGECDLSSFLIPYPSLLYGMAYLGLFSLTIPFLRFGLIILNPKHKLPIKAMIYIHFTSVVVALLLQFVGTADLMKTLYWFHIIAPLGFVVFAANLLREYFCHGNKAAARFALATILLAASVVLEVLNYWLKLTDSFTVMFQLGTLAFIVLLGVESGRYVRETMNTAAEKLRLEYEMAATREREQRLASENASLDRMNRLKSELMETISHEARTPLAVLSSYAGLVSMELKDKGVDVQIAADLDKVVFEAKRVADLIDSMRKLTLTGEESAKRIQLDFTEVARQTAELYRHIFERDGISLVLMLDENVPTVFGSPEELTQVLLNLLQNARNHTKHGFVTVSVRNNEAVTLTVEDTGEGIPSELLLRVFERGVSGGEGSGIGLAVCKEIIASHGGTIEITSRTNTGTVAIVSFPAYKDGNINGK